MDSWKPHGIIDKPSLKELYRNARFLIDIYGNEFDPKELSTVYFFKNIFNKSIFKRDMFFVNSQQPPSKKKGLNKACDIITKHLDQDHHHQILCFVEAKWARYKNYLKIQVLEKQVKCYCQDFLETNQKEEFVYVCTLVSAMRQGTQDLVGFWDGQQRDDFQYYRDMGLDEHKEETSESVRLVKIIVPICPPLGTRFLDDRG